MKRFIFALLSVVITLVAYAQKPPVKFGSVTAEEMMMSDYKGDTSVSAVILCDYGYFSSATFQFTRTLRIKILKPSGTSYANNSYPTSSKSMIKGITYNLVDGKVVQEKLKNESIYSERVSEQYYRMRVAMPNVKAGSIIDIQFTYDGFPGVWKFQADIPVKHSELIIEDSPYVRFAKNFFGFVKLNISTPNRWAAFDVPAFKAEPFINSEENYITKLEFDLLDISYGTTYRAYSTSWDAIFKNLMSSENFGMTLQGALYLNDLAKWIEASSTSKTERVRLAFDAIKQAVKWDENVSLVTSNPSLAYIYRMKVGNSADINLMLYQLLKKLEIEAIPVAMSSRDNGVLSPIQPSSQKLNYVIVMAKVDTSKFLLDATEEYMPYNLLPKRALNYRGRTVKETGSEWVDITTKKSDKTVTMYDLKLEEDLTLTGSMVINNSDYGAFNVRKYYHTFNSADEYIEDMISDNPGLRVNSSAIEMIDSIYKPVTEKYEVTISEKVTSAGNELYILPLLFDQVTDNPFTAETRIYPIDFGYNSESSVIVNISVPATYTISALPAPAILRLPKNGGTFRYEVVKTETGFRVISRIMITKSFFMAEEYSTLREFYNQVIKKHSEPVILKQN